PDSPVDVIYESDQLQQRIVGGQDVANITTKYRYTEGRIETSKVDDLPNYTYTHDNIGNVTSEASQGTTKYFGYDRAGQLCWRGETAPTSDEKLDTTCHAGPSGSVELGHDSAGNNTNIASNPIAYNSDSQVATIDGLNMGYLDRGNDLRVTSGSTSWANSPLGVTARKVGTDITHYVRDPNGQVLASYGTGGIRYYFSEFNGSVAAIYNSAGTEVGEYTYSPYGHTTATSAAAVDHPFRYIGGLQDKDSQGNDTYYKLGARYYDAQGHFTQPDPIIPGGGDYSYASGDPINFSDPSGNEPSGALGLPPKVECTIAGGFGTAAGFMATGGNPFGAGAGAGAASSACATTAPTIKGRLKDVALGTLTGAGVTKGWDKLKGIVVR
ncbi:MAG: hypothetical protein JWR55_3232, partial [Aeromicrobium sp.]|nr:hypothetical protein [Aeromicrobium sp.]